MARRLSKRAERRVSDSRAINSGKTSFLNASPLPREALSVVPWNSPDWHPQSVLRFNPSLFASLSDMQTAYEPVFTDYCDCLNATGIVDSQFVCEADNSMHYAQLCAPIPGAPFDCGIIRWWGDIALSGSDDSGYLETGGGALFFNGASAGFNPYCDVNFGPTGAGPREKYLVGVVDAPRLVVEPPVGTVPGAGAAFGMQKFQFNSSTEIQYASWWNGLLIASGTRTITAATARFANMQYYFQGSFRHIQKVTGAELLVGSAGLVGYSGMEPIP